MLHGGTKQQKEKKIRGITTMTHGITDSNTQN